MQPAHRDALATRLADAVVAELPTLLIALTAQLPRAVAVASRWDDEQNAAVRERIRQLLVTFVQFLRIGDLEVSELERARASLDRPLPLAPSDDGHTLFRPMQMSLLDQLSLRLQLPPDDELRKFIDTELGRFALMIEPLPATGLDPTTHLDAWLMRVEAAGVDLR